MRLELLDRLSFVASLTAVLALCACGSSPAGGDAGPPEAGYRRNVSGVVNVMVIPTADPTGCFSTVPSVAWTEIIVAANHGGDEAGEYMHCSSGTGFDTARCFSVWRRPAGSESGGIELSAPGDTLTLAFPSASEATADARLASGNVSARAVICP